MPDNSHEEGGKQKAGQPKILPAVEKANVIISKYPQRAVAVLRKMMQEDK